MCYPGRYCPGPEDREHDLDPLPREQPTDRRERKEWRKELRRRREEDDRAALEAERDRAEPPPADEWGDSIPF